MCLNMYRSSMSVGVPWMDCTGGGNPVIIVSFGVMVECVLDMVQLTALVEEGDGSLK
jgi:hypothetical protein